MFDGLVPSQAMASKFRWIRRKHPVLCGLPPNRKVWASRDARNDAIRLFAEQFNNGWHTDQEEVNQGKQMAEVVH